MSDNKNTDLQLRYNFEPIKSTEITLTFFVQPEVEKPHCTKNDKRYEQPFEDDGAYAD